MDDLNAEQEAALQALLKDPAKVTRLLAIAEEDERKEWLFSWIRKGAAWVAGVLAAAILTWDALVRFLKGIVG